MSLEKERGWLTRHCNMMNSEGGDDDAEELMATLVSGQQRAQSSTSVPTSGTISGYRVEGGSFQFLKMHKRYSVAIIALVVVASIGTLYGVGETSTTTTPNGLDVNGVPPGLTGITWDRPPLHELIGDFKQDILEPRENVQFLLDFAIIGHSKCSTTFHNDWILQHEEVQMYDHEIHSLRFNKPAELVSLMYALPDGNYKRGYKAPNDIRTPKALEAIRTYWPETALIVGLRHPVKWFESYYNFNTRVGKKHLPPAVTLVGDKLPDHVRYHVHLSDLGKTNVADPSEAKLLGTDPNKVQPPKMPNKVFLFEVSQPFDERSGRDVQYRKDLSNFIGLSTPLQPFRPVKYDSPDYHYTINICDGEFQQIRTELLENGRNAAAWIVTYFLGHPDVTVSSPAHFKELLQTWSVDPCKHKVD